MGWLGAENPNLLHGHGAVPQQLARHHLSPPGAGEPLLGLPHLLLSMPHPHHVHATSPDPSQQRGAGLGSETQSAPSARGQARSGHHRLHQTPASAVQTWDMGLKETQKPPAPLGRWLAAALQNPRVQPRTIQAASVPPPRHSWRGSPRMTGTDRPGGAAGIGQSAALPRLTRHVPGGGR